MEIKLIITSIFASKKCVHIYYSFIANWFVDVSKSSNFLARDDIYLVDVASFRECLIAAKQVVRLMLARNINHSNVFINNTFLPLWAFAFARIDNKHSHLCWGASYRPTRSRLDHMGDKTEWYVEKGQRENMYFFLIKISSRTRYLRCEKSHYEIWTCFARQSHLSR